jgi:hypothetical protein
MKAYVFINKELLLLGHVGWGFETSPGQFCYGSKETTGTLAILPGCPNNVFVKNGSEASMLKTMKAGVIFQYHYYKVIEVPETNIAGAEALALSSKQWGYLVTTNNCMDYVFKIIKCYACDDNNVLPWPATHITPNEFFQDIKAKENRL